VVLVLDGTKLLICGRRRARLLLQAIEATVLSYLALEALIGIPMELIISSNICDLGITSHLRQQCLYISLASESLLLRLGSRMSRSILLWSGF